MESGFLGQVAGALYDRYGDEISSLSVVFPNRRAGLFFGKALSGLIKKPLWQPSTATIGGLMEEIAGLQTGEKLRLVVELYNIYKEFHPDETFEKFYFWGELLLADFDSIDKYLIDADVLFSNLVDLHELDNRFDYLSDEQKAIISKFWGSFNLKNHVGVARKFVIPGEERSSDEGTSGFSPEQADFLKIWRTLAPIYHRFRARLRELGVAYEGMVYREAAERIKAGRVPQLPDRHYVIAGFNALSRCEQVLFEWLKLNFEVDFYWDWDDYFQSIGSDGKTHEAGLFMSINLQRFPAAGPLSGGHANFEKPKTIRSISTASDVVQCKFAGDILAELSRKKGAPLGTETAVVLADENLLTPLLYSLPQEVTDVNITMGYPLRMHPAYVFFERELVRVLKSGRPWREISDHLADKITAKSKEGQAAFFALILDHIRTLRNSLDECAIDLEAKTYALLLRRSLQTVTIPFEGEPLEGVQVMGILETRALDFDNIVFLSCGDSSMPGNLVGAPSFIPYNLKKAFGLPTPEDHEGVYAYHLFRLISRAKNVDMLWSSVADEKSTGEPSRYIRQLDYESPHHVEHQSITVDVNLSPAEPIVVEKTAEMMARITKLSPTTLFEYVECPLKFYFRAVAGLRAPEEEVAGVDNAQFGEILHGAMQRLYAPLVGVRNPQEKIRALIGSPDIERAVNDSVTAVCGDETGGTMGGAVLLAGRTIGDYIERAVLPFDASRKEYFTIEALEYSVSADILPSALADGSNARIHNVSSFSPTQPITFHGRIDRLDTLADGTLRVVDYKTGSPKPPASDSAVFQIGLYRMILERANAAGSPPWRGGCERSEADGVVNGNEVVKTDGRLYFVRDMSVDLMAGAPSADEFAEQLQTILQNLFDLSQPFVQCAQTATAPCQWCDFAPICQR